MSLILFLAAAAIETAPAPAADIATVPATEIKRVCKSVMTPESRVKKKICTNVRVKVAPAAEANSEAAPAADDDEG